MEAELNTDEPPRNIRGQSRCLKNYCLQKKQPQLLVAGDNSSNGGKYKYSQDRKPKL